MGRELTSGDRTQHLALVQGGAFNILYLDDDTTDLKLMSLILRRRHDHSPTYNLSCVTDICSAREALKDGDFDIFVLDNRMPSSPNFHSTLAKIGPIDPLIKLVVVSSEIGSNEFHKYDNLTRKPDAVIEKSNLNKSIKAGFFHGL